MFAAFRRISEKNQAVVMSVSVQIWHLPINCYDNIRGVSIKPDVFGSFRYNLETGTRRKALISCCNAKRIELTARITFCETRGREQRHLVKPRQNDWTFALNMHWTFVQCKMLRRFATLSNHVQSCSAMLRVVHSILKAVKNVQWTRLNFFCLKMLRQDV